MSQATRPAVDDQPLAVRMMFPGAWWNEDQQEEEAEIREELVSDLPSADVVLVVDSDADGLGCEVVAREFFEARGESVVVIQAGHREAVTVSEAGDLIADHAGEDVRVIIADLCPSEGEGAEFIAPYEQFSEVAVCDHHDWSGEKRAAVTAVAELVVDAERCATQILLDYLYEGDAPEMLREFADVTADHDLWIKEDERSDDLSDYAFHGEREDYVAVAREYGANIMEDDETREVIEQMRWEKQEKIRLSLEGADEETAENVPAALPYQKGADWYTVAFDECTVTVPYDWYEQHLGEPAVSDVVYPEDVSVSTDALRVASGDMSAGEVPESLETLVESAAEQSGDEFAAALLNALVGDGDKRVAVTIEGPLTVAKLYGSVYSSGAGEAAKNAGADLTVIVPPWDKVSLRSRDETPIAAAVAGELGGGGHPVAAGAKRFSFGPNYSQHDHWFTAGKGTAEKVFDAIESVTGGTVSELASPPEVDEEDDSAETVEA